jgi:peptidoglycan hydrolase-like protein with peptidoglycan-binding domain
MSTTSTIIESAVVTGAILVGMRAIGSRPGPRKRRSAAALIAVALLASACSDDDDASTTETSPRGANTTEATATTAPQEAVTTATTAPQDAVAAAEARVEAAQAGVTGAQDAVTAAGEQFCSETTGYIEALDRYGKLFTEEAATVGDVKTGGADLVEPRESVASAASDVGEAKTALAEAEQELVDAQAALAEAIATASSVPTSSTTPATTTTTTIVPPATIERVQQAEDDLAQTAEGITNATPLTEATSEYNSAAFALQIAWLKLLSDAGCLTDEQQAQAVELVTAYTTTLQTELQQVGYYDGSVDGIYGPQTVDAVERLQADTGLRQTGFVDMATGQALDDKLAELGQQAAAAEMTHTAAVQTVLTLAGFWTGGIDGQWTDELTTALQAFQTALGVEPTGVVDAATLAAFEQALAELASVATATTSMATTSTTTAPPTAAPTSRRPTAVSTSAPPTSTG